MNFLLLNPNEISQSKDSATVCKVDRLSYVKEHFVLNEGATLKVGVIGGELGTGVIKSLTSSELVLDINLHKASPKKKDLTLIVSVCRPQTNKKILHIATSLGVKKITFIRGENVPKSYLDSSSLSVENIKSECLLAMEQVGDTIFPDTIIYESIYECFQNESFDDLSLSDFSPYLVADTQCTDELTHSNFNNLSSVKCIAIGPESGWSEKEIEYFHKKSFKSIGLGERILRVEVALCYLLGKLS